MKILDICDSSGGHSGCDSHSHPRIKGLLRPSLAHIYFCTLPESHRYIEHFIFATTVILFYFQHRNVVSLWISQRQRCRIYDSDVGETNNGADLGD